MVVLIFTKWAINWDERMLSATCEFLDPNTNAWVPCPDATSTCYVHGNYPESGTFSKLDRPVGQGPRPAHGFSNDRPTGWPRG